jgi:ParB family transcriptional regulator, chromosome partitioning protein
MPRGNSAGRISIRPLDDLFEPTVEREQTEHRETLPVTLSPDRLKEFPNHPFKVREDEELTKLAESIKENGVLEPILCRPDGNGDYQIVSGHRRLAACKLAGLEQVPVTVRDMDDDTATMCMVDANLHRESILPSEKAFAFKMKLEALEHKRQTGLIVSDGRRSTEIVGEETGDNYRNVMRYIRLTELSPQLLELVDSGKLKFHPAVELSYLKPAEQEIVYMAIQDSRKYPSLTQTKSMKQLSQQGRLDADNVSDMLRGEKTQTRNVSFKADELRDFFPQSYSTEQIKDAILNILEARQRSRAGRER